MRASAMQRRCALLLRSVHPNGTRRRWGSKWTGHPQHTAPALHPERSVRSEPRRCRYTVQQSQAFINENMEDLGGEVCEIVYASLQETLLPPGQRGADASSRPAGGEGHRCRLPLAILLHGDVGAGKTSFARGFIQRLQGLSIRTGSESRHEGDQAAEHVPVQEVTSPTYLLRNSYSFPVPVPVPVPVPFASSSATVHHYDLYRLQQPATANTGASASASTSAGASAAAGVGRAEGEVEPGRPQPQPQQLQHRSLGLIGIPGVYSDFNCDPTGGGGGGEGSGAVISLIEWPQRLLVDGTAFPCTVGGGGGGVGVGVGAPSRPVSPLTPPHYIGVHIDIADREAAVSGARGTEPAGDPWTADRERGGGADSDRGDVFDDFDSGGGGGDFYDEVRSVRIVHAEVDAGVGVTDRQTCGSINALFARSLAGRLRDVYR